MGRVVVPRGPPVLAPSAVALHHPFHFSAIRRQRLFSCESPMFQLVHASTRTREEFPDAHVQKACVKFRNFNKSRDITSLLLVGELNFMQVLEGPKADTRALYERIRNDGRHSNVQTDFRRPDRAAFPTWSMRWPPAPLRKPQLSEILPATAPSRLAGLVSNFRL